MTLAYLTDTGEFGSLQADDGLLLDEFFTSPVVPAGGVEGQVLTKTSTFDYYYDWRTPPVPEIPVYEGMKADVYDPRLIEADAFNSENHSYNGFPLQEGAPRFVSDKLRDIIDARDFGCRFDGVTDDWQNLQYAINAAAGRELRLPPGTAVISKKLVVPDNIYIRGVPGLTWLHVKAGSLSNPYLFDITGKTNVTIFGVGFDGNASEITGWNTTNWIFNSNNITFEKCQGRNNKNLTLAFTGTEDFWNCRVIRCKFVGNGQHHLVSGNSNDRKDCIWFGGALGGKGSYLSVEDCEFDQTGLAHVSMSGSLLRGLNKAKIINCRMGRSDAGCIYFSHFDDILCHGNIIAGCDGNGIDCINIRNFTITGNIVRNCTGSGIGVFAGSKRGSIVGNVTVDNWAKGGWSGSQSSAHRGGITFHATNGDVCEHITVTGNTSLDTRSGAAVTQRFAIGVIKEGSGRFDIRIEKSNVFEGYDALGTKNAQYVYQTFDLGAQPYPAKVILDASAAVALSPMTERGTITFFCENDSVQASISSRAHGAPILIYETVPGSYAMNNSGSGFAVFNSGSSLILYNRTGAPKSVFISKELSL